MSLPKSRKYAEDFPDWKRFLFVWINYPADYDSPGLRYSELDQYLSFLDAIAFPDLYIPHGTFAG